MGKQLTFAEQLMQLEEKVKRVSGLTLTQFDALASRISEIVQLTGLSTEDVTQILQGASAHTGISMSDLAKTLEDMVIQMKGDKEDMLEPNYRYSNLGAYKGHAVHEMNTNDFIAALVEEKLLQDTYYVITETRSVVFNNWVVGSISQNRRSISEVKHIPVRTVYGKEIDKRVNRSLGNKMNKNSRETLITSRPAISVYVKEGEKRMAEQARRGRELVESLKRPSNG